MGRAGAGHRARAEAGVIRAVVAPRRPGRRHPRSHRARERRTTSIAACRATRRARRRWRAFGNIAIAKENTRAVWIPVWIDQLLQDGRYGVRHAARGRRAFSAVVILTLALGIGLTTAVFSVFNAVLLRPLAYPPPERLVSFSATAPGSCRRMEAVGGTDFLNWRGAGDTSFEKLAAYQSSEQAVVTRGIGRAGAARRG